MSRAPRRRLGLGVFAIALIVILLLTAFGYAALRANYEQNQDEAITGVERTARLAGALGSSLIGVAQQELAVLSRSPAILDGDVEGIQRTIDTVNPASLAFTGGMVWVNGVGQVSASWPRGVPGTAATDLGSLEAVKRAFGGATAIETLPAPAGTTMRPIAFAVPTYGSAPAIDQLPAVNGVLVASVVLPLSAQDALKTLFGTDAVVVIDQAGGPVFGGPKTNQRSVAIAGKALDRVGELAKKDAKGVTPDDITAKDTKMTDGVFRDIDGSVVGYSKMGAPEWLIVLERPRSELFAPLRWQFERSLFALGLLFLVSLLGAALAAMRLDRVHRRETDSRRLFQTVLEQLPVGVAAVDKAGRVVVTNDRADAALGARPEPGKRAPDSLRVALEAMRSRSVVRDLEVRVGSWKPTDDESRTLVVRAAPVESGGQVTGAAAIVEDVTEQREREARSTRLASATAELALASSREQVASVVADAVRAFGAQAAMVVLRHPTLENRLILASASGFSEGATDGWETIDLESSTPVAEAARTGQQVFVTIDEAADRFPDMGSLFASSGNHAWAALPLRSAGRIDGALGMSFREIGDIDMSARSQLVGFAALVSQALDRASRQSIEHDVAMVLQRGLLQPASGHFEGVEIASRYVPAEDHLEVGGDFFDVLPLADGAVMLVIGDVVGHGLDAASAMGQLRSAARALSATTSSPARLLELLDRFAAVVPPCRFATAAIVVISADRRTLRYSVAGHPSPVWHDATGAAGLLDGALSRPLGVYPSTRPEATMTITEAGATVCLYTDGLIEKRGEIIDVGLDLLVATMARHHDVSCEVVADRLLAEVGGSGPQRDDICIVCARF